MSDEKLRQLLSVLPDEDEIVTRAARARRQALARLEEPRVVRRAWRWAPVCLALGAAAVAAAIVVNVWRVEPLPWSPPAPQIAAAPLRPVSAAPVPVRARRPLDRRPAPHPPALAQRRLQVHWVLSDGTRVEWTFDKDFSL